MRAILDPVGSPIMPRRFTLAFLVSALQVAILSADDTPIRALRVSPDQIRLTGSNRRQQILVTAESVDGKQFDLTDRAQAELAEPSLATFNEGILRRLRDGQTELIVRHGSLEARVPVVVADADRFPPVHFENDIVPLFSKLRCNGSGCHGKQSGQNGFRLSIFGHNPRADFRALVQEGRGRRIFPAAPDRSLLLLKAVGLMPHGGGRRAEPNSMDAKLIREWIAQGSSWGSDDATRLTRIEIEPAERLMGTQANQRILVTAVFSDGGRRDVTHAASYGTNDDLIAEVDERGHIATGSRLGEAAITVNYMGHVGAIRIVVPRPTAGNDPPEFIAYNPIDDHVRTKLRKLGVEPSNLCDDATFFRRLYLDTIGTLPTLEEATSFANNPAPNKRIQAIEDVLDRDEFADYWALRWSDVLLVNSANLGERGAFEFHRWLRQQVASNRPYDQWVRELLTATGNSGKYGPVNFYRAMRTPQDVTKTVSQAFLGIRLDCAQCHHHPFEKWGQDDFYGLAGYFTGVQRKKLAGNREFIFASSYSPAKMPVTNEPIPTRPLDGEPLEHIEGDPRVHLADWLTARENPWFAKLVANRLWKHYMGRGLVEPEDDLRSTNPATNEPLLNYLTEQVVESGYDLRAVMGLILTSRVYQLSSETNGTSFDDEQNFSHHLVKRLPAEVLLDAISQATGSPEHFAGAAHGTRSIELWDNRLPSYFLDTFGRSERESPCECAKSSDPTMAQALHLLNAPEIDAKIASPEGRIAALISRGASQDEITADLCFAALARHASEKERTIAAELFAQSNQRQAAEDFLWTLLNSYEFLFIH
ncbi:MAG: hypothetical protein CMJ64_19475 [Planctomycetaceae bacterium]|nr:hypothetical protein [Planctomycetaceae bacterium]